MNIKCYLKQVTIGDADILYEWINEEECRKNSLNTEKIEYADHMKWFQNKLNSSQCYMFILYNQNIKIGQIRIDIKEKIGIISYSIAKKFRKRGYGYSILQLLEQKAKQIKELQILEGIVKYNNLSSQKIFEKLGFKRTDKEEYILYQKIVRKGEYMYIPYGTQSIDDEDIKAVVEVLKSNYLTTGPTIQKFEQKVADYLGVKYAVAVANGTAALHAACFAAGIQQEDEVITTPITFAASANCVLYCNGTPVFADICPDTYNIDPEDIKRKITKKTKAIIPVDFTGQPCELDQIYKIAKEYNLIVIEDAAHALGAEYKGKKVGSLSDMTIFSFHPVKHITTGEGGMITTNNETLYKRLLLFRTHGITREKELMTYCEGDWYYQQLELGFNYRITDLQCALGISQMNKLDRFIKRRKQIAEQYNEAFHSIDGIIIPYQADNCSNSWHLYVIQVNNRKYVFDQLRSENIGVNVHYIPVYKHPYYQKNGYKDVTCKYAEQYYEHTISIPMYPELTKEQQEYVIEKVIRAVNEK